MSDGDRALLVWGFVMLLWSAERYVDGWIELWALRQRHRLEDETRSKHGGGR